MQPFVALIVLFAAFTSLGRLATPFTVPVAHRSPAWARGDVPAPGLGALGEAAAGPHPDGPSRPAAPDVLVTVTGVCEILGAIGLMIPSVAPCSAAGLSLMLLAMFPANVHAARERLAIGGRPVTRLGLRAAIQVVFVSAPLCAFFQGLGSTP